MWQPIDEYLKALRKALDAGEISVEAYDASIQNIQAFCIDEEEEEK